MIAALSAVTVLSCTSELTPEQEPETSLTLRFSSEMPLSKTHWDGNEILWSGGDKISVTYSKDGVWASELYESDALGEGGEVAEFTVPVGVNAVTGKNIRFHTIYPSSAVNKNFSSAPVALVEIPAVQTPSPASFDSAADLMYGYSVETFTKVTSDPIGLLWLRQTAHSEVTLLLPQIPQGEVLQSICFTTDQSSKLVGTYRFNLNSREIVHVDSDVPANVITVNPTNLQIVEGKTQVWLSFLPCDVTYLKVSINTDKASYVREITDCYLEFDVNTRNILSVDMTESARAPKIDPAKNALVNKRLFEVIDLDAPGLEAAKEYISTDA